jgi:hypothetical protein
MDPSAGRHCLRLPVQRSQLRSFLLIPARGYGPFEVCPNLRGSEKCLLGRVCWLPGKAHRSVPSLWPRNALCHSMFLLWPKNKRDITKKRLGGLESESYC